MECASLFRVVSEVNRRRVLSALNGRELSVQDLQNILTLGQSTLSAHLSQLKLNQLVDYRRNGRFVLYRISTGNDESIDAFVESVIKLSRQESWHEKDERTIQSFLEEKKEASLSFYEGLETQNKRAPGQTDFALAVGLMRSIRNKRIVDIGCGNGNLVKEFSYLNKSVVGIDIDERQIETAKTLHLNEQETQSGTGALSFLVASGDDTRQKNNSIDLVIMSHSLHHIQNPQRAVAESYRILDTGGVIIIVDLHKHEERWMKDIFGDIHLGFNQSDVRQWLEHEGFSDIKIDLDAGDMEYPQFETLIVTAVKSSYTNFSW